MTSARDAVVARLAELFGQWPQAEAMHFGDRRWVWGDIGALATRLAVELADHQVAPEAAVAVVLRQRPPMVAAELAVLSLGRGAVLMSPLAGDSALAEEIGSIGVQVAVLHETDWQRAPVAEAIEAAGMLGIVLADDGSVEVRCNPPRLAPAHPFEAAVTVLTSGTTGAPKRLPVPWEQFVELGGGPLGRSPRADGGALILSLPLVTLGGLLSMARLVFGGRPLAFMERFDMTEWASLVKAHRPQLIGAPPPVVSMILAADISTDHFEGVTAFVTSSAAVPVEVARAFEERYGIPVLVGYGATEFLGAVTGWTTQLWREFGAAKAGSVGRVHPGVGLRVVDPDDGRVLGPDEVGLIEVDPPRRAGGLAPGWMRTNDLGRVDADRFVWIEGRADDVIVRGGFKLNARTVGEVLRRHPAVADACVVGLPDTRLGQVPGALVVLHPGAHATAAELDAWVGGHLASYCRPAVLRFADAIPLTATSKAHLAAVAELLSS